MAFKIKILFITFFYFLLNTKHSDSKPVINPLRDKLRIVGLYLAAHKYFEVDRRTGSEMTWKYDERVYHKYFPLPRLKRLHPEVRTACDQGVLTCIDVIADNAVKSYSLKYLTLKYMNETNPSKPFATPLELFQYRASAAYFLCWFTMQRSEYLMNYMSGSNCLQDLEKVKEKEVADKDVVDFRHDSIQNPFLCAEIQFCPNYCYGRRSGGSVPSQLALIKDSGNPCKHLKDPTCTILPNENTDFDGLQRNMFNISCSCQRSGFIWSSRFELCVDVDECKLKTVTCTNGQVCQNLPGSYKCVCRKGYRFDAESNQCVELVPIPSHSLSRTGRVKAIQQTLQHTLSL
ncbi:fibulin-2-like isoform X3 [Biomphalaria glabrata]|uniref:Fibulin-2-like isoform X3 n=1 Tax=Biomphalaria glabrata TaxID=6526 RepID=A0A9W3B5N2_BIOGL|nr:fibulin-2-like isoform X3 [Biomphalaria glabrata]